MVICISLTMILVEIILSIQIVVAYLYFVFFFFSISVSFFSHYIYFSFSSLSNPVFLLFIRVRACYGHGPQSCPRLLFSCGAGGGSIGAPWMQCHLQIIIQAILCWLSVIGTKCCSILMSVPGSGGGCTPLDVARLCRDASVPGWIVPLFGAIKRWIFQVSFNSCAKIWWAISPQTWPYTCSPVSSV